MAKTTPSFLQEPGQPTLATPKRDRPLGSGPLLQRFLSSGPAKPPPGMPPEEKASAAVDVATKAAANKEAAAQAKAEQAAAAAQTKAEKEAEAKAAKEAKAAAASKASQAEAEAAAAAEKAAMKAAKEAEREAAKAAKEAEKAEKEAAREDQRRQKAVAKLEKAKRDSDEWITAALEMPSGPPPPLEMEVELRATVKGMDRNLFSHSTSDAYFILWGERATSQDGELTRTELAKSEVIHKTRSPQWKPIVWPDSKVKAIKSCDAVKIEVYDKDLLTSDDPIGSADLIVPWVDVPCIIDLDPIQLKGKNGKVTGRVEGSVAFRIQGKPESETEGKPEPETAGFDISQQATKIHNDPQLYIKRKGVRASFFQHQNVDLLENQGKLVLSYVAEAGFGDGVTDGATIFAHIEAWKKPESKTSYDFSLITSDFGVFSARATTQEQFDAWEEIMEKHQDKMVDPKTLRKKSSTIIV